MQRSNSTFTLNAVLESSLTHDESARLLGEAMGLVALTAGCFVVGACLGRDMAYGIGWLWVSGAFACNVRITRSRSHQPDALRRDSDLFGENVHYAETQR